MQALKVELGYFAKRNRASKNQLRASKKQL